MINLPWRTPLLERFSCAFENILHIQWNFRRYMVVDEITFTNICHPSRSHNHLTFTNHRTCAVQIRHKRLKLYSSFFPSLFFHLSFQNNVGLLFCLSVPKPQTKKGNQTLALQSKCECSDSYLRPPVNIQCQVS